MQWREHVAHAAPLLASPKAAADKPSATLTTRNYSWGTPWCPGVPFSAVLASEDARIRRRAAAAMVPLLDALGFLLLRGGCFHADPHAGNLLLQARARRRRCRDATPHFTRHCSLLSLLCSCGRLELCMELEGDETGGLAALHVFVL